MAREVNDRQGQAETLNHMDALLTDTTGPADGLTRYTDALTIASEIGARLDEADALDGIGRCLLQTGNPGQGLDHLRQVLRIYQEIGAPGAARVQVTRRQHAEEERPGRP